METKDLAATEENLRAKYAELFDRYLELRAERQELRQAWAQARDMGCECDSNQCRTEKRNQPLSGGETDSFCHDDQDAGSVSVLCVSGEIEVIIYRAVWSTYDEYDRKRLSAGQNWQKEIDEASGWADQTNRVDVLGHQDSVYNLDFKSWDN